MIPVIYPANETAFTTNGLGGLPDAISCVVTEQRNTQGGYYLEMEYPVDGLHYDLLAPERIIYAAPSMGNTPQPFRISRITRPINGIVHIEAPHISAQLQKITTSGTFTARSFTGITYDYAQVARGLGQTFPFFFSSDKTFTETQISFPEPAPFMDVLLGAEGSILDKFGGEYEWNGREVILHDSRGVDSGLEIRYGVNMSDLEAETDATELVTAVVPFWKGTVNDAETVVIGDMCSASNASAYAYVRCVPLDVSQQFEETDTQPTKAQVTAKGQAFIDGTSRRLLQTSIRVSYEPTTSGIGERLINLCDTVRVVYPDLNVSSISKVVETRFNVLTERYDELTIGTIRNNIVDTIAGLISGGSSYSGGGSGGGGGSAVGAVLYNMPQNLNEAQKAQARSNIGVGSGGGSAVNSVNGKTGVVVLDAEDVGALPDDTVIPSKTSELTNDSNYQTGTQMQAALAQKQNVLVAGQNVSIDGDVISADVDSAEIAAKVSDWLDDNVTPVGSAVVVDRSLSVQGAAADAKATGNKIFPIEESVCVDSLAYLDVFGKYWVNANGELVQSNSWIAYQYKVDEFTLISADLFSSGASQKSIAFYSGIPSDSTFISGIRTDSGTEINDYWHFDNIQVPSNAQYVLITNRSASGSASIRGLKHGIVEELDERVTELEAETSAIDDRLTDAENVVYRRIGLADADLTKQCYFSLAGKRNSSTNYTSYVFDATNVQIIDEVVTYIDSSSYPTILFFSCDYQLVGKSVFDGESYFISAEPHTAGQVQTYRNLKVPSGCKAVVIVCRTVTYENPSAIISLVRYSQSIDEINADVETLFKRTDIHVENVANIYPSVWNANDFCIIDGEFWLAKPGQQSGVENSCEIRRLSYTEDGWITLRTIYTDFGHFNCFDYCPENDCLIFGNGANSEDTEGNWFAVVPHPKELSGTVRLADVGIKYNVDIGFKVQAVWGDNNLGRYNIAIVFSNNATTFKKYLLKRDSNGNFNGEFVEVESATTDFPIGVGGADYWGGKLYIGGSIHKYAVVDMSDYSVHEVIQRYYDDDGNRLSGSMQGIFIDDKYLWIFFNIANAPAPNYIIQYRR